jgi:hypothetical protein
VASARIDDASGTFALARVPPGDHQLVARTDAAGTGRQRVTVGAGERKTGVKIVVEAAAPAPGR